MAADCCCDPPNPAIEFRDPGGLCDECGNRLTLQVVCGAFSGEPFSTRGTPAAETVTVTEVSDCLWRYTNTYTATWRIVYCDVQKVGSSWRTRITWGLFESSLYWCVSLVVYDASELFADCIQVYDSAGDANKRTGASAVSCTSDAGTTTTHPATVEVTA